MNKSKLKDLTGKIPNWDFEDEHIVRRLGAAVVFQWSTIPDEVRNRIIEQSVFVYDDVETVQLKEQIESFISKHQDE